MTFSAMLIAATACQVAAQPYPMECPGGDFVGTDLPRACSPLGAWDFPVAAPEDSALLRRIERLESRVDRLEILLQPRANPRNVPVDAQDRFDTEPRLRSLGDRIDRRLDSLSR